MAPTADTPLLNAQGGFGSQATELDGVAVCDVAFDANGLARHTEPDGDAVCLNFATQRPHECLFQSLAKLVRGFAWPPKSHERRAKCSRGPQFAKRGLTDNQDKPLHVEPLSDETP